MKISTMGAFLIGLMAAISTHASTIVLEPGDGRQYLIYWCGGQGVNEYAEGFDTQGANVLTALIVTARCSSGGRGARNRYHKACWQLTYDLSGVLVDRLAFGTVTWLQGQSPPDCGLPYAIDASAVFTLDDQNGEPIYTSGTASFAQQYAAYGPVSRAYLTR